MSDSLPPVTRDMPDGTWRFSFHRHVQGGVVYANKGLADLTNRDGQATNIIVQTATAAREEPLSSAHTTSSVADACRRSGAPVPMLTTVRRAIASGKDVALDHFVVHQVELAYAEMEVYAAPGSQGRRPAEQQVMQPYYVFRNEQDYTLYVPAIADPYVT